MAIYMTEESRYDPIELVGLYSSLMQFNETDNLAAFLSAVATVQDM